MGDGAADRLARVSGQLKHHCLPLTEPLGERADDSEDLGLHRAKLCGWCEDIDTEYDEAAGEHPRHLLRVLEYPVGRDSLCLLPLLGIRRADEPNNSIRLGALERDHQARLEALALLQVFVVVGEQLLGNGDLTRHGASWELAERRGQARLFTEAHTRGILVVTTGQLAGARLVQGGQAAQGMHRLLVRGTVDELELAWRNGCPVDSVDERGRRALYLAAASGEATVVLWLLRHGASPNQVNAEDGRNALHAACAAGHADVVEILLDGRDTLDMTARDLFGLSAAELAVAGNHLDLVRLLLTHRTPTNGDWLNNAAHVRSPLSTPSRTPQRGGATASRGTPTTLTPLTNPAPPFYTPRTRMRTPHRT